MITSTPERFPWVRIIALFVWIPGLGMFSYMSNVRIVSSVSVENAMTQSMTLIMKISETFPFGCGLVTASQYYLSPPVIGDYSPDGAIESSSCHNQGQHHPQDPYIFLRFQSVATSILRDDQYDLQSPDAQYQLLRTSEMYPYSINQ